MEEIWKDIDGLEGFYQISNLGNVKSLNYCRRGYERLLVPKQNNKGRLWVELRKNGDSKLMLIHRLVAMAFIPNPNNFPQINHIDENPKNNRVENLEWCTSEYNNRYSRFLHPERFKEKKESKKYKRRLGLRVSQFSKDGELIRIWENSRTIQLNTGMSDWSISECCRGNRHTAYGYVWRYAN